jgi:hypothetical protein
MRVFQNGFELLAQFRGGLRWFRFFFFLIGGDANWDYEKKE